MHANNFLQKKHRESDNVYIKEPLKGVILFFYNCSVEPLT